MSAPINLNQARKLRDRAAEKATADENAIKFGRTKAERLLEAAQSKLAADRLNNHQFDDQ